jgi:hypothetical protein
MGHGSKFGRKKEEAIAALIVHRSPEEAARAIGIAHKTLLRWLKDPEFDTEFRAARRATYSQAVARLQQGAPAAVSTLLKVMLDQNMAASTKVRASECTLNHAAKAIELEDIEARVAELERAAEASKPAGRH